MKATKNSRFVIVTILTLRCVAVMSRWCTMGVVAVLIVVLAALLVVIVGVGVSLLMMAIAIIIVLVGRIPRHDELMVWNDEEDQPIAHWHERPSSIGRVGQRIGCGEVRFVVVKGEKRMRIGSLTFRPGTGKRWLGGGALARNWVFF